MNTLILQITSFRCKFNTFSAKNVKKTILFSDFSKKPFFLGCVLEDLENRLNPLRTAKFGTKVCHL